MNLSLNSLNNKIIKCRACPRLIKFRNKIIKNKRKQFKDEVYWGKPITGFGDPNGKILIVGLAPAAHGGTRTGRVFTGDRSAEFLYKCLHKAKIRPALPRPPPRRPCTRPRRRTPPRP